VKDLVAQVLGQVGRTGFTQAVRLIERSARRRGRRSGPNEVGADTRYSDEPIRFTASPRMTTATGDLDAGGVEADGQVTLTANILGLAGATPALPAYYSELQLQRRRLRDPSLANFLNIFNHRTLSFFFRAARKHHWTLAYEREPVRGSDQVTRLLLALGGLGAESLRGRLVDADQAFAPLAGQLGGIRRSAAAVATTLTEATGMPVRIREAQPNWMAVPVSEQSRLGSPLGPGHAAVLGVSAMVGRAVLDVQHHFTVEIGPLDYSAFLNFCKPEGGRRRLAELTALTAGLPYHARARVLIRPAQVPPLQLGVAKTPALLGQTTWLCPDSDREEPLEDCSLPLDLHGYQESG
jgi:type VI secretion system protein ImpH